MKPIKQFIYVIASFNAINGAFAQTTEKTVDVGGAPMYPKKNIKNAINSREHTTLVAAIEAGGLVETLEGAGPFTVFAPASAAFTSLPAGTWDMLVKPENREKLTSILTYHIVAGKWGAKRLGELIRQGIDGAEIKTVQGGKICAVMKGYKIMIMDKMGSISGATIQDMYQSNGVIFVIDRASCHIAVTGACSGFQAF